MQTTVALLIGLAIIALVLAGPILYQDWRKSR